MEGKNVSVDFWRANKDKAVRIVEIMEFSTPRRLMTIPFPDGVEEYIDLPQSFIDQCFAQAAALAKS